MKPVEKGVTVPENGAVSLDFEFESKVVERPIYETQEQFKIGPGYRPKEDLMGCEGPFCVHKHAHRSRADILRVNYPPQKVGLLKHINEPF
ncbi:MAG: hypothetical protein ACHQYP_00260 [Nitrospiria bacterium]